MNPLGVPSELHRWREKWFSIRIQDSGFRTPSSAALLSSLMNTDAMLLLVVEW